jgi:hypothetical protein
MPVVTLRPLGESGLYHLHVLEGRLDPGYGRPGGGHPDQGLPGYGHPDQGLPGYGHPDQGLPGGGHISNRPPGSVGGIPDNSLPSQPPPQVKPGYVLVLARGQDGKWHYAALAPGSAPPKPLPEPLPPDAGTKPND